MIITRRALLGSTAAGAGSLILPRFAIGQSDNRPTVTIAVQQVANSGSLEPLREQSNVGTRTFASLYEGLIGRNYQGELEPIPALAESWTRIDARTVELKLRRGVRFHNGDEMTAEDVVFTYGPEHMFGTGYDAASNRTITVQGDLPARAAGKTLPPEVVAIAKRNWPALERVEAVDKYTVRFVNRTPDLTMEGRIARSGSEIISRRGFEEAKTWLDWARKPVTTGPFKVREYTPDQSLVLDAHDEYWGGRPSIRTVRFVVVPEVSSRINGLLSGQFDFACDLPPDQIPGVEKSARHEVRGGKIDNHRLTVFDKTHPELADPRIRRAFTHAIDRQAIVDALWAGRTTIPAGLQWEFYGPMYVADWKVPEYNPKLAQSLLKEAGYKGNPIPYRLLNNYYINQVATAQVLVEMWRSVGLNVQIEMKENWTQMLERGGNRAVRDWSNSAPFGDPVSSLVNQHGPNGQQQQVGEWTNAELNTLAGTLESEIDMAKRKAMFRRMLEICEREDPAYTVLHQNATFTGVRKDIRWRAAPSFAMDLRAGNFAMKGA